jgi:hypothetical protein
MPYSNACADVYDDMDAKSMQILIPMLMPTPQDNAGQCSNFSGSVGKQLSNCDAMLMPK